MGRKPLQTLGEDTNTRERLLNAAGKEFDEKGYYLTNGDAIAKRAGLGHGTFYIYFKNKNEVLIELLQRSTTVIPYTAYRKDPQYLMRHADSPKRLEAAIMEMIKPLSEIPGLLRAFFQGMLQDRELIAFGMRLGQDLARMFREIIVVRQREGTLQGCDARTLSEIMAVCLATSTLMTAAGVIACSPQALVRNLCGIMTPLLFPPPHGMRPVRLRPGSQDSNDNKIRCELLKAAREEFIQHGYFETKIAHVAQRSGYSRRTFYHYYKGKDELLKALFVDMLGNLYPQAGMQGRFIEELDPRSLEDLVRLLSQILQSFDTPINWAFLQGFFNSPDLAKVYQDIVAMYGERIAKKLSALQVEGHCPGMDAVVTAYIIVMTISYTAFLRAVGFIHGGIHKCAVNLGWFLFCCINHTPPKD